MSDVFPSTAPEMSAWLQELFERGALQAIDCALGRALLDLSPSEPPFVGLTAALTSRAVQTGHVCLDLPHFLTQPLLDREGAPIPVTWPELDVWRAALASSAWVATSTDFYVTPGAAPPSRPLLMDTRSRVYLQRYADYQRRLVERLKDLSRAAVEFDEHTLADGLARYFPQTSSEFDEQRFAALLAVRNRFTLISGGPGTGKTTTVARILLLLQEQAAAAPRPPLRLLLLAPTGKAAQRLSDALKQSLEKLGVSDELRAAMPEQASTIHRALGYSRRTPTRFRHHREHPLSADVVLVDESSMVDLALMTKLVEAVPEDARLILLGDKDQLASVEAGAIFGDLFNADAPLVYTESVAALAERLASAGKVNTGSTPPGGVSGVASAPDAHPMRDVTVHLTRSFRYDPDSGIGRLARGLREVDFEGVERALGTSDSDQGTRWVSDDGAFETALRQAVLQGFRSYSEARTPEDRLSALESFRLLCAHRSGPRGVEGLNRLAETVLVELGLEPETGAYPGRPILITQNDYQLELFNGDVGVIERDPERDRLVAHFRGARGMRRVPVSRLPAHETVFAMTVHKSQGSEFEHVAFVLPERPSPVFSRELFYTGVTRARSRLSVFGSREVLRSGLESPIHRSSGLLDALWER